MLKFIRSSSIVALGACLALMAPGDIPTADNNYSFFTQTYANDASLSVDQKIRRSTVRQSNDQYRLISVTQDNPNDGNSAGTVAIDMTYRDELGNSATTSTSMGRPRAEKVYFDWTPPSDFAGGPVYLGCIDCGDDGFSDVPIELGFDADWSGDNQDVTNTTLTARATRRGDGTYRFRLKGKPAEISAVGFQGNGETPLAGLTVNGEPAAYQFTREVWRSNLEIPEGLLDNQTFLTDTTLYDEQGVVLDTETRTEVLDGQLRGGLIIDSLKFTENNKGKLKLLSEALTDEMEHSPKLNAVVTDENTSEELLVLNEVEPTLTEYQFGKTFTLFEPGNFNDMTYVASIELINEARDAQLANFDVVSVASEGLDDEPSIGTSGDWNYALSLTYLENFENPESGEGADDVGLIRLAISGADITNVKRAIVRLVPEDGGSELDEMGDDGDLETVEPPFVLAWHAWTEKGQSGIGGLENGGAVSYDLTVAGGANFDAAIGENDRAGGTVSTLGFALKKKGDTHKKKEAKRAYAHFGRSRTKN